MGDVVGMHGPGGPPSGTVDEDGRPGDHPYDVLHHRLTQAGAVLHVLRMAMGGHGSGLPADHIAANACWAVNVLLEQAEAAAEAYDERVKKGRP